jgi:uncharacterized protein (TIGR04255 family)
VDMSDRLRQLGVEYERPSISKSQAALAWPTMPSNSPFPIVPRKVFANNPLIEVVCELRFPPILRIDNEIPSEFQELVRGIFPGFEKQNVIQLPNLPEEVSKALAGNLPRPTLLFQSPDESSHIALTSRNMAILSNKYEDWATYKQSIELALSAFIAVYNPSFFERIGIRYRNLISREKLNLADVEWGKLLNPAVAGELIESGWHDNIIGVQKSVRCSLPYGEDSLHFLHGLGSTDDNPEISYVLDFDYIANGRLETQDVDGVIERLHGYSGSAFQWAISERLKLALD